MASIAFDVYLNGERKFTAGAEEWQSIFAVAFAQRIDPAVSEMLSKAGKRPTDNSFDIRFTTRVSAPSGEEPYIDSGGFSHVPTKSGNYPSLELAPGDVVEIKVIQSGTADAPEWQDMHRARANRVIVKSISDSE